MEDTMRWTGEQTARLKKLWEAETSVKEIVATLRREGAEGVTESAVIAKRHRLHLQSRLSRGGGRRWKTQAHPDIVPHERDERTRAHVADAEPWMCCWPIKEPGRLGLYICGQTKQPGRDLCAGHITARHLQQKEREKKRVRYEDLFAA